VDDLESHSGAETMPASDVSYRRAAHVGALAVLVEDVEALLDEQRRVQHDQAVADGQHIVASPRLEECADGSLAGGQRAPSADGGVRTRLSICSLSAAGRAGRASRFRGATKADASRGL
jgi:hypothetical protein